MDNIAELERRITAALVRIDQGIEALALPPEPRAPEEMVELAPAPVDLGVPVATLADGVAEAEIARLNEALDDERMIVSQLQERLRAARHKEAALEQEMGAKAAFEAEIARQSVLLEAQGVEMGRLKAAVTALRNELRHLREASAEGRLEPHLINTAMHAELEAMRAERAAEAVELRELLAALDPLALVGEEEGHHA